MQYVIAPSNSDIKHHGILGQKWGKQNGPPYPLGSGDHSATEKKAGWRQSLKAKHARNKAMKSYDYRQSDTYKNGSQQKRNSLDRQHIVNRNLYGDKAARRIEYKRDVEGVKAKTAAKQEVGREVASILGTSIAILVAPAVIDAGARHIANNYASAKVASAAASAIGKEQGLNVVNGGFTFGAKHVKAGKEILKRMKVA